MEDKNEQLLKYNVEFSKLNEYEIKDERYTECLIKILHLGRNYNNSVFKKEVVDKALPSLANMPIVGYIEKDKEGKDEFSDHREVLVQDEDGNIRTSYAGSAFGCIPESYAKEAYYEDFVGDDGVNRTYLMCKGILWNQFDNAMDIFDKNNNHGQSMELSHNYKGHFEKDGFVFDEFKFRSYCILHPTEVQPAMNGATIEVQFRKAEAKSIAEEVEARLNEFNKYFSKKEEDKSMEDNKKQVLDNSVEEEKVEDVVDNSKNENEVETEEACEDKKKTNCEKEDSEVETDNAKSNSEENIEDNACENKKKYSVNFELSHDDIRCKLYDKLFDLESIENAWYCIDEVYDNHFNYVDCITGQHYTQEFSKTDTEINFVGERKEVFSVKVDKETYEQIKNVSYSALQKELEESKATIEKFSKENSELTQFKNNALEEKRKGEIDLVVSKFSKKLSNETLEEYKKNYYENGKSSEELNNDLFVALGKLNYSKEVVEDNKEAEVNYSVSLENQNECPYKGLENLFN